MHHQNRRQGRMLAALGAAGAIALGGIFALGEPAAFAVPEEPTPTEQELPRVEEVVSSSELEEIGETQDAAEIEAVLAARDEDQHVQVLYDFESGKFSAAVLVDKGPELTEFDESVSLDAPIARAPGTISPLAVNACTSGGKGISRHVAPERSVRWCGTGKWTGAIGGWYQFSNLHSSAAYVGTSSWSGFFCFANSTCNVNPAVTLGFIEYGN